MVSTGHAQFLRNIAAEIPDNAAGVLVVSNFQIGRRRVVYCPNCGRRIRLGLSGTGVAEIICRSRSCVQNPHETKIIFQTTCR